MQNRLKTKIGILGGGQLGKMMIEESLKLNVEFNVLENDLDCPCNSLADNFILGKLTDEEKINELAAISDVLTYEIEHVNTSALLKLEEEGKKIIPSPRILKIIQDKGLQKTFYSENNIPTSNYFLVENKSEWTNAIKNLGAEKFVAKTRKDGYDGKGVCILNSYEVLNNPSAIPFDGACVLEEFVNCKKELSVIVAKDVFGNILCYPIVEMEFDAVANLVTFLFAPADISIDIEKKAKQISLQAVDALNSPGLFAVELFLTHDDTILINEIAPRPHNSGHHTIEACNTSQFEQLVRILIGLPLGNTNLIQAAAMINLLGDTTFTGHYRLKYLNELEEMDGVYIHLYGKKESKPMRKLGHITVTANTLEEVKSKAKKVMDFAGFEKA